jgi:hypothetical protein
VAERRRFEGLRRVTLIESARFVASKIGINLDLEYTLTGLIQ